MKKQVGCRLNGSAHRLSEEMILILLRSYTVTICDFDSKKQTTYAEVQEEGRGGGETQGRQEGPGFARDSPIVHRLGEPAKDGVPVGQVGFLLGHVLLTVAQHLREQTHKPLRLLLQHAGAQGAQVQEVACRERRLRARGPDRHASSPRGPLSAGAQAAPSECRRNSPGRALARAETSAGLASHPGSAPGQLCEPLLSHPLSSSVRLE